MNTRRLLLSVGLLFALALAVFGDKTPNVSISEPTPLASAQVSQAEVDPIIKTDLTAV